MNLAPQLQPRRVFDQVAQAAQVLGLEAFVVGGYVRDLLLNRGSGQDIDFVCVGDGVALARAFAGLQENKPEVVVYQTFGTALVKLAGGLKVEFVGARKESYSQDSRNPEVEPGTLEEDQLRRDFTVNALAVRLTGGEFGELVDPFGGLQDLEKKMLRTPAEPSITFSDDPLRMMRAVRFAAQLGFDIDPDAFAALQSMARRIKIVAPERVAEEMNKLLMTTQPGYGLKLAYYGKLLQEVLPELTALAGVEYVEGKGHKDNFFHTLEVLQNVIALRPEADLWLRWGAVLHDVAKTPTKRFDKRVGWTFHGHEDLGAKWVPKIFRRLRLPLDASMRKTQRLVRLHLRPIALVSETVTDSAVRRLMADAEEDLEDLMTLARADVTTKNPNKAKRYLANFDVVEEKMARVSVEDRLRNFQPVLTGNDIMEKLGLPPGKEIGRIKEQIREEIIEGVLENTFEACEKRMWELAGKWG